MATAILYNYFIFSLSMNTSTIKIVVASNKSEFIKMLPNLKTKDNRENIRIIEAIHFKKFMKSSPLVIIIVMYLN
ncbi:hypothetical protein NRP93_002177 [Clostridium botulinum]|nr:hypothetical protein [Clostridium botulinum]